MSLKVGLRSLRSMDTSVSNSARVSVPFAPALRLPALRYASVRNSLEGNDRTEN
jgi:hypothetical protein